MDIADATPDTSGWQHSGPTSVSTARKNHSRTHNFLSKRSTAPDATQKEPPS